MESLNTYPFKLHDTERKAGRGRVSGYWTVKTFNQYLKKRRTGPALPKTLKMEPEAVTDYFHLKGFEFGNWLNQADRWEYFVAGTYSLYDISNITGLYPNQIGLNYSITVSYGGRGQGRRGNLNPVAHFEPGTGAINITRYDRDTKEFATGFGSKDFYSGGGIGSFGHEWAHAFDWFIGFKNRMEGIEGLGYATFLSDWVHIYARTGVLPTSVPKEISQAMMDVMMAMLYTGTKPGTNERTGESDFYKDLKKWIKETDGIGGYWKRPHEMFARLFEVYLDQKGHTKGIENPLLFKKKYSGNQYLSPQQIKPIIPLIDRLFKLAKKDKRM